MGAVEVVDLSATVRVGRGGRGGRRDFSGHALEGTTPACRAVGRSVCTVGSIPTDAVSAGAACEE